MYVFRYLDREEAEMNSRVAFVTVALMLCVSRLGITQAAEPIPVAHRGLLRHAPENTIPAFLRVSYVVDPC